ncbi:hypothetical protein BGZ57DRAFT_913312 [Hyaloscypha finlandica]|nr:hypothetical protein BGZ57DRAFT_913312 [Hyaloscypha finlandica]
MLFNFVQMLLYRVDFRLMLYSFNWMYRLLCCMLSSMLRCFPDVTSICCSFTVFIILVALGDFGQRYILMIGP